MRARIIRSLIITVTIMIFITEISLLTTPPLHSPLSLPLSLTLSCKTSFLLSLRLSQAESLGGVTYASPVGSGAEFHQN